MRRIINRRLFFKVAASGVAGTMISPMELFPRSPEGSSGGNPPPLLSTARNCIFVLMHGAPSQVDTFDLKVGSWTPSDFNPTTIQGMDWPSGILPRLGVDLAQNRLAIVRSCQAPALIHSLQQTWAQIGRSPSSAMGRVSPNVGSIVALEKESERQANQPLPGFLSISAGASTSGAGYFPARYGSFDIAPSAGGLANLRAASIGTGTISVQPPEAVFQQRYQMMRALDQSLGSNSAVSTKFEEVYDFYASARGMMYNDQVAAAFAISSADNSRYGSSVIGQQLLTAKNVLKANLGVRYVQINYGNWDHHAGIYAVRAIRDLARPLDAALSTLINDLASTPGVNGTMLDETLIVVRGEFGRTVGPLNYLAGRDHYFNYSALLAGGGVRGGRAIGSTTSDGASILEPGWSQGRPVSYEDFAATTLSALGINYRTTRHDDPLGIGFQYVADSATRYIGEPITELFR
jgi:hypothetical protein